LILSISVSSGAVFSLFFVLLFVPVLYSYYADALALQGSEQQPE